MVFPEMQLRRYEEPLSVDSYRKVLVIPFAVLAYNRFGSPEWDEALRNLVFSNGFDPREGAVGFRKDEQRRAYIITQTILPPKPSLLEKYNSWSDEYGWGGPRPSDALVNQTRSRKQKQRVQEQPPVSVRKVPLLQDKPKRIIIFKE